MGALEWVQRLSSRYLHEGSTVGVALARRALGIIQREAVPSVQRDGLLQRLLLLQGFPETCHTPCTPASVRLLSESCTDLMTRRWWL